MKLGKYLIIFLILFLIKPSAQAAVFSFDAEPDTGVAVFPKGTMFRANIQQTVSSKTSKAGDPVSFVLNSDITVGKSICIPKDSIFLGQVLEVKQAQQGRDGYFRIIIDELVFVDGWRTTINARVWDKSSTDIIGGDVTEMTQYTKVPHYIENIGPMVQLVKSGPREMGKERALPAGKEITIVLDNDLEVKYLQSFYTRMSL